MQPLNPPSLKYVRIAILLLCFKHTFGLPDIPKVAAAMGWLTNYAVMRINSLKRPTYLFPDEDTKLLLLCYQYTRDEPRIKDINEEYHCIDADDTRRETAIKGHKLINKIIRDLKEEYAKPENGALFPSPGTEASKNQHYGKTNAFPDNHSLTTKQMRELRKKDFDVEWIGFVKLTKEAEETVEDEVTAMDNEGVEEFYDEYQTESKYRAEHPGCTPQ